MARWRRCGAGGLAVRQDAIETCVSARQQLIAERIRGALAEALHGGLSPTEIRKIVAEQLGDLKGSATVAAKLEPTRGE